MKTRMIILTLLVAWGVMANAQEVDLFKQEVVEVDLSKDEMWNNLKTWVSTSFNKSKNVIDYEDKEAGKMILKFNQNFGGSSFAVKNDFLNLQTSSLVTIDVKDNKYRYTVPHGAVSISIGNIRSNIDNMNVKDLRKGADDMDWFVDVCTEYFNESTDWVIDDNFDEVISIFKDKLSLTPEKNKRGKPNPEWEALERRIELLHDIKDGYSVIMDTVLKSLKREIVKDDDF